MKIRSLICATMALALLGGTVARAQEEDRDANRHFQQHNAAAHHWARGDRLPAQYKGKRYEVSDWRARHYKAPPRGYHYVRTNEGDVVLAAVATGVVADILLNQR